MELSSIANEKLLVLYERIRTLMRKKLHLDPIFLGKKEPEFIEKFLVLEVRLDSMEFVDKVIRETIRKRFHNIYLVALKGSRLNIRMLYFTNGPFVPTDKERVRGIFKRTIIIRELLHLSDNYVDQLTFYVFPTDYKKRLPDKRGVPLGPFQCNTGSTDLLNKKITLWRTEEMNKVLVHELLHHYRVDENVRRLSIQVHFDEVYTEWLTTILHTMFESIEKRKNYSSFKKSLSKQIDFSLYQAAKVLYHYQMEHVRPGDLSIERSPFHQKTNAYEYYILKAALLYHLSLVIRHMDEHTLIFEYPLEFLQTVMDSLDGSFIKRLNNILAQKLRFTRTLRMVIE